MAEYKRKINLLCAFNTREARRQRPDLVYGRYILACFLTAFLGLKTIVEVHQPPEDIGIVHAIFFKGLLKCRSLVRIVAISNSLKTYLIKKYKIADDVIQIAHDGADIPNKKIAKEKTKSNDRVQVGYIGHLYPGKGTELVYEIASRCPWADFHLVGGTEKDILFWEKKIANSTNIFLHGFLPPPEAERLRLGFDILLAPYQKKVCPNGGKGDIAKWMSPLKIFEYMASGKPIICADLPVLREVLKHQDTAILCPPDEIDAWVKALLALRDHPDVGESLGRNAKQEFMTSYNWQSRAIKVIDGIKNS